MNPTSTAPQAPESDPFGRLLKQVAELFEYASYYVAAKADEAKLSARRLVLHAELIIVGLLAAAGLIVTGVSLVFIGLAGGVGEMSGKPWLGQVVSGSFLIVLVGFAVWGRTLWLKKHFFKRTVERYEQRQLHQQTRFGRSVADQAAAASAKD